MRRLLLFLLFLLFLAFVGFAGFVLHWGSDAAPSLVTASTSNVPRVSATEAIEVPRGPEAADATPARTERSPVATSPLRIRLGSLDKAQARAYQRLQQVLKDRGFSPLPTDGYIEVEDLESLVSSVTALDEDVERTYNHMARKSSEHVVACEKEILHLLSLGRDPPYEIFTGQKLRDDPMSFVSVMTPAGQSQRYIIRTPESKIATEKAAWAGSVTAEAEFADKVVRQIIQQ